MNKSLTFELDIQAPRHHVWRTMLDPEGYRHWTTPFCQGSTFEGSWDEGAAIRFLSPSGDGMVAEIAEHRPGHWVSIRHLGMIERGVVDTHSDKVRAWAPAYENYRFEDRAGGCHLTVSLQSVPDYEAYMQTTYPLALAQLKALCEQTAASAASAAV